jgi:pimeloyl-ACP methyl ester carboxylesterase
MILKSYEAGEGHPLVLLHGLFGAARNLGVLTRALAAERRVVALDLRNHGDSPHAPGMDYLTMAADVAQTMESLGLHGADVAGHSMGGKTAMALALSRPDLVARVAVLDIAPMTYDHDYDDFVQVMLGMHLHHGLTRAEAEQELAVVVKAAPMRAFLLNNLVLGAEPRWRVNLRAISAAMPELLTWRDPPGSAPFLGEALFLYGALSHYVTPEAEPVIHRLFPRAQLRRVEGAAHWLHADKPAEVLAALREFFTV